jgi:hypothetical protein
MVNGASCDCHCPLRTAVHGHGPTRHGGTMLRQGMGAHEHKLGFSNGRFRLIYAEWDGDVG